MTITLISFFGGHTTAQESKWCCKRWLFTVIASRYILWVTADPTKFHRNGVSHEYRYWLLTLSSNNVVGLVALADLQREKTKDIHGLMGHGLFFSPKNLHKKKKLWFGTLRNYWVYILELILRFLKTRRPNVGVLHSNMCFCFFQSLPPIWQDIFCKWDETIN